MPQQVPARKAKLNDASAGNIPHATTNEGLTHQAPSVVTGPVLQNCLARDKRFVLVAYNPQPQRFNPLATPYFNHTHPQSSRKQCPAELASNWQCGS